MDSRLLPTICAVACYSTFTTTYIDFGGPSTLTSPALVGKAESSIKNKECYQTNWVITSPGFKKSQVLPIQRIRHHEWWPQAYAFISNNMKRKTPASVSLPPKDLSLGRAAVSCNPTQRCLPSLERNATQLAAIPHKSGLSSRRHRWLTAGSAAEGRNPSMSGPDKVHGGTVALTAGLDGNRIYMYSNKSSHADARTPCTAQSVTSDIDKYYPPCTNHGFACVLDPWRA